MLVQLSDELSPVLAPGGNTVTLHLDENLTIEADPEKLARVFNNILKNAASYSFPHTEIVISAEKLEHEVIIQFQNSGEDIPNEALVSLFDKFYRVDQSRSSDTGGTGLGRHSKGDRHAAWRGNQRIQQKSCGYIYSLFAVIRISNFFAFS